MPEMSPLSVAGPHVRPPSPGRSSLAVRLVTLLAILVPLGGVMAAPFFVWGWGFG